jgi:hypothetical protein
VYEKANNDSLAFHWVKSIILIDFSDGDLMDPPFSAATYLLLGGGGYKSMRDLVKSAKRERRGKWKENVFYDQRSSHWFDRTTGAPVIR